MKEENEDQTKGVTSQDQNGKVTPRSTENNSNEIMGSSCKDDDFGEAPHKKKNSLKRFQEQFNSHDKDKDNNGRMFTKGKDSEMSFSH